MAKPIVWDRFQELYDLGLTDQEIANEMYADVSTVGAHRRDLGLPSNWSKAEVRSAYYAARRGERQRKAPAKSLSEVAREARERGMSYGEYMTAQREGRL